MCSPTPVSSLFSFLYLEALGFEVRASCFQIFGNHQNVFFITDNQLFLWTYLEWWVTLLLWRLLKCSKYVLSWSVFPVCIERRNMCCGWKGCSKMSIP
jgi:hypothetical protein